LKLYQRGHQYAALLALIREQWQHRWERLDRLRTG